MEPRDFVYWLQGYFEISEATTVTEKQLDIIKNHLNLVFHHSLEPPKKKKRTVPDHLVNSTKPPVNLRDMRFKC